MFSQKTNKNNSTWDTIVVKRNNFFVRFLGELKIPKRHFEINWPLIRNFLDAAQLFTRSNLFTVYQVNWHVGHGKWFTIALISRSLNSSLTVCRYVAKRPDTRNLTWLIKPLMKSGKNGYLRKENSDLNSQFLTHQKFKNDCTKNVLVIHFQLRKCFRNINHFIQNYFF